MFWTKRCSFPNWKEPALDTQTYCPNFLKMVLQDFSEKKKKMALGALNPQNLEMLARLVPMKRTFDDCMVGVSEYILLINMVKRAQFGPLFLTPKLLEKT